MPTKKDPYSVSKFDKITGGAALKSGGSTNWELGQVTQYYAGTHSMDVTTHSGRSLKSVPRLSDDPKNFSLLKPGTNVVISYDLPFPVVVGTITVAGTNPIKYDDTSITGVAQIGSDDPMQRTHGALNYRDTNAPSDLAPGDKAWVGTLGNLLAVLEGGVTVTGSPNAQTRSHALLGLLETVASVQRNVSDWGEWKIENDQGKVSFILRAGSNTQTETGLDEEHWTIRIDLGHTGNVFNFEITTPTGNTLFKFHVGPDGRLQLYGHGGVDISSGPVGNKEQRSDIAGDDKKIVQGNKEQEIVGNNETIVHKGRTTSIGNDDTIVIGNDKSILINRDKVENIGGKVTEVIAGGSPLDAKKNQFVKQTYILNGGWEIDIGNPKQGANITAQAGYKLRTHFGGIDLEVAKSGKIRAIAKEVDSVILGGDKLASHVVKYEELKKFLYAWGAAIDAKFSYIESQLITHFSAPTPVAHTPIVGGPPYISSGQPFTAKKIGIPAFKSVRVGVGK